MYRFLLRPRWVAFAIVVALLAALFVQLGRWQLHRWDERQADNTVIRTNAAAAPRPLGSVLARAQPVQANDEWARVTARGRYDNAHQILVRYRALEGEPGYHVLTPFVMQNGSGVLINRGWIPGTQSTNPPQPPAAPRGEVQVVGRVRPSETAEPGLGRPADGQVRFIDVDQIAATLPYPVVGGYLERIDGKTAPSSLPRPLPAPSLSEGPHLAYALQWFLFALIAIVGLGFLAYDEAHDGQLRRRMRGSVDATAPREPIAR